MFVLRLMSSSSSSSFCRQCIAENVTFICIFCTLLATTTKTITTKNARYINIFYALHCICLCMYKLKFSGTADLNQLANIYVLNTHICMTIICLYYFYFSSFYFPLPSVVFLFSSSFFVWVDVTIANLETKQKTNPLREHTTELIKLQMSETPMPSTTILN